VTLSRSVGQVERK